MHDDLDVRGLALELHRSTDWTQRHWRRLIAEQNLPRPFIGEGPHGRPWWRRSAVLAWKERGVQGLCRDEQREPAPANDLEPHPAPRDVAALLDAAG